MIKNRLKEIYDMVIEEGQEACGEATRDLTDIAHG